MLKEKLQMANLLAQKIEEHYGFRPIKCLDMAMQGDWWNATRTITHLQTLRLDVLADQLFADIDSGKIK